MEPQLLGLLILGQKGHDHVAVSVQSHWTLILLSCCQYQKLTCTIHIGNISQRQIYLGQSLEPIYSGAAHLRTLMYIIKKQNHFI